MEYTFKRRNKHENVQTVKENSQGFMEIGEEKQSHQTEKAEFDCRHDQIAEDKFLPKIFFIVNVRSLLHIVNASFSFFVYFPLSVRLSISA